MNTLHYLGVALGWVFLALWVWMLVDCIKNEEDPGERVTWALLMIFLPPLFVPIYFFRCYGQRVKDRQKKN